MRIATQRAMQGSIGGRSSEGRVLCRVKVEFTLTIHFDAQNFADVPVPPCAGLACIQWVSPCHYTFDLYTDEVNALVHLTVFPNRRYLHESQKAIDRPGCDQPVQRRRVGR